MLLKAINACAKKPTSLSLGPIPEDTISSLRHRLTTMRQVNQLLDNSNGKNTITKFFLQIFGDSDDEDAVSKRKKQAFNKINRRNKNCMDNILDGE